MPETLVLLFEKIRESHDQLKKYFGKLKTIQKDLHHTQTEINNRFSNVDQILKRVKSKRQKYEQKKIQKMAGEELKSDNGPESDNHHTIIECLTDESNQEERNDNIIGYNVDSDANITPTANPEELTRKISFYNDEFEIDCKLSLSDTCTDSTESIEDRRNEEDQDTVLDLVTDDNIDDLT